MSLLCFCSCPQNVGDRRPGREEDPAQKLWVLSLLSPPGHCALDPVWTAAAVAFVLLSKHRPADDYLDDLQSWSPRLSDLRRNNCIATRPTVMWSPRTKKPLPVQLLWGVMLAMRSASSMRICRPTR